MADVAPSLPPPGPSWLQPLIAATTQVGVPTVIAGVLLWFVLTQLHGMLAMIQQAEEDRTRLLIAMQETVVAAIDRQTKAFELAIKESVYLRKHYQNGKPPH